MSNEITNTNEWRNAMHAEAERLEAAARLMRVMGMADDQIDAITVLLDFVAAAWHRESARAAREHGRSTPTPRPPVSKLLTRFAETLREKAFAVGKLLPVETRQRLVAVAPAVQASLEAEDPDVVDVIARLMPESAEAIAFVICWFIDVIEKRFAS